MWFWVSSKLPCCNLENHNSAVEKKSSARKQTRSLVNKSFVRWREEGIHHDISLDPSGDILRAQLNSLCRKVRSNWIPMQLLKELEHQR
ncbi:hypothetical protein EYF80_017712 [Liparis tanakae]|uniref:Uncharacterized protein n=1 Tax=Liparis tanakae TaxID=230148 RepID=A0A4Z2I3U4_9TELE|nr:hypothetical protein EYF80_017712 [Liparis tanakae]